MNKIQELWYEQHRKNIAKRFDALGRGARTRCSFDLKIAITTVSRVLTGNLKSESTLAKLEAWLKHEEKSND